MGEVFAVLPEDDGVALAGCVAALGVRLHVVEAGLAVDIRAGGSRVGGGDGAVLVDAASRASIGTPNHRSGVDVDSVTGSLLGLSSRLIAVVGLMLSLTVVLTSVSSQGEEPPVHALKRMVCAPGRML